MFWRATSALPDTYSYIRRFDPRFFTINFPMPMIASAIDEAHDRLRVEALFYRYEDLAGLIWESKDRFDHPLLAYVENRDYRGLVWSFRWRSSGVNPLDAVWAPVLTIEGRDAGGNPRTWYVRLWNYASGSGSDAVVTIDFDKLAGGFLLPDEADPVYAGDIDRLFFSLVPAGYDGYRTGPLPAPLAASVTLSNIRVQGSGAPLAIGDCYVKPHGFRIANGYDDVYNLAPGRLLRNIVQLGYRGTLVHYIGMSHFFRLGYDPGEGRFIVQGTGDVLANPVAVWHQALFAGCVHYGLVPRISVSFELLAQFAPAAWAQRTAAGEMAETGWSPPSTLLSPCNGDVLQYLRSVFFALIDLLPAGMPVLAQVGEPWWWFQRGPDGAPCFYDAATAAAFTAETGQPVPAPLTRANEIPDASQAVFLDWLKGRIGAATLWLRDELRAAIPGVDVALLIFPPELFGMAEPLRAAVNYPVEHWIAPAFDRLQIEDYDYLIAGDRAAHRRALEKVGADLGYGLAASDYFAGFVLDGSDAGLWRPIMDAADAARTAGYREVVIWALPQILRDGVVVNDLFEEEDMSGFHEVLFPVALSFGATGGPRFSTTVVETSSGFERRNVNWAEARGEYDVGMGLRSETDMETLLAFFRARAGRAYGFRFRDWLDWRSCEKEKNISPLDQNIGLGDGMTVRFPLVKIYADDAGQTLRRIYKPVAGSVRVAIDGVEAVAGSFSADTAAGAVIFDQAPAAGAIVSAGYAFDVPVRFASDQLSASLETFRAGSIPSIPLVEIRCREDAAS